jgi:hypothetical protein
MSDLLSINIKGGAIRQVRFAEGCNASCSACNATLPRLSRKVSWHDGPGSAVLFSTFEPQNNTDDGLCVAADETVVVVGQPNQVPANYLMMRIQVPPYHSLDALGVINVPYIDEYGITSNAFTGLQYDIQANEADYDPVTCTATLGADVSAAAVPAVFSNIDGTVVTPIIAKVAPATGGYMTGAKSLILSIKIDTPPATSLSKMQGTITLQANVSTFDALVL